MNGAKWPDFCKLISWEQRVEEVLMEEIIQEALNKGVEMHVAGEFDLASKLYESVINLQPNHADANHNMGLLKLDMGNDLEALPYLQTALQADTSIAQFWLSYIRALIKLDKTTEATRILDLAKESGLEGEEFVELYQLLHTPNASAPISESETDIPGQSEPNILDSLKLNQALRLAEKVAKEGDAEEAKRIYQNILAKFPKNKRAQQGLANLNKPKQPTATQGPPQDTINQLLNLYNQGQLAAVVDHAQVLIKEYPEAFAVWNILGAAAAQTGLIEQAVVAFERVIAIQPDNAAGYNNLANAFKEQGKLEKAIEYYQQALKLQPDHADACNNMGVTLQGLIFTQPNPDLQKIIISLLDKKTIVTSSEIASAAISLLKFEPKLDQHLQTSSVQGVMPKVMAILKDLSELPLLLKLMSVCPLPDLELENLFRELRKSLLLNIADLIGSAEELEIQSALALHCFTNEYIYNQSEREDEALAVLEASVKQALSKGEQPSPQSILCLASYKPLNQYEWSSSLLITDKIEDVFIRQVIEPNQESRFKTDLPVLEEITDKVSSKVRDQYEVSPYPRWVDLGFALKPAPISKVVETIKLKLFDDKIQEIEAPNILIAGCGTGQHSIFTATRFKDSKVLAIDLSLSSLSYAKRKTQELGINNIEYLQADILDLGKLGRQFDIVESAGVLHHMQDPVAGWRVLTDCLKPGGLMRIGLYSELARQHIVKIRQEISKAGIGSSDVSMKSFRTTVIKSDHSHHKQILNSSDFYSLSELKDLLFHVQEHRFTIPQIQDCLSELGLKFCGFETDKIVSHFKLTRTSAGDPYELAKWQAYEEANPRAFAGMYQFWCQKVA